MIHRAHIRDVHQGRLHKGYFGQRVMEAEDKIKPFPNPRTAAHKWINDVMGPPNNKAAMKASREAAKKEAKDFDRMMSQMGRRSGSNAASAPVYGGGYAMTAPATVRAPRTVGVGGTATAV